MTGRRAPSLSWCSSLALLLSVADHVTSLDPVSSNSMRMGLFEPALNSRLPDSMVLAELTTSSSCACQQACLARHDCFSASATHKTPKERGPANTNEGVENPNAEGGVMTLSAEVTYAEGSVTTPSGEVTCRLGRRRGHPSINIADSTSLFWERLGRSQLGDHCTRSADCLTAGAVCHEAACLCAAGLRADGRCRCPLGAGPGEPCWFQTCAEVRRAGVTDSGVYLLRHRLADNIDRVFQVRCEMTEDGHGWTVIQARDMAINNGGDFNRSRLEYRETFGDVNDNYWLGLRLIREIIQVGDSGDQVLRIVLQDAAGEWGYAVYDTFNLGPEGGDFKLKVDFSYNMEAGTLSSNVMIAQDGRKFSTYDADFDTSEDVHCARLRGGGWWFHNCRGASLNGAADSSRQEIPAAILWPEWRNRDIIKSMMMIRPTEV